MAAEGWQRVKDVFQAAVARDPKTRPAFLDDACAGDAALRHEVESLLASHDESGAFLSRPVAFDPAGRAEPAAAPLGTRRIGSYRLLETIAHGGMGTVYRAVRDDDSFQQTVALKLVRAGGGSEYLARRFRQERQILARFQHPNIATVFDGGTTGEGQPYLVMEYVEGRPITEFCAAERLSIRERLALFRTVCDAVQYAHQSLVVHRDLKPDNILVRQDGVPKLLDFGIAKLLAAGLDPDESPTATLLPMMTPEYASPEQIKGEAVTTASDVYSLGVLLYELLSGRRPYTVRADSLPEIVRMVCDTEPPLPSAAGGPGTTLTGWGLRRRNGLSELRGDLDTIVMKALRKDPARRYASVQDLATDIRRHLEGLPVLARPDTLRYRASKFVARHTVVVAAAALVFASLVGAVVVTTRQARIAERRALETRHLANALVFDAYDAVKVLPGGTAAKAVIIKLAIEYLDRLAAEPHQDRLQRLEFSTAYVKLGDAQGLAGFGNLGDTSGALASYRRALAIREELAAEAPGDPKAAQQVATVHNRIGRVLHATGDVGGALEHHREGLRIAERAARSLGDAASRRRLVVGHWEVCNTLLLMGRTSEALREAREAKTVAAALLAESPTLDARNDYAAPLECEGDALMQQGDAAGALVPLRESLAIAKEVAASDPRLEVGQALLDAVALQTKIAELTAAQGALAEARRDMAESARDALRLARNDRDDVEGRLALADARLGAATLTARADPRQAVAEFDEALTGFREVAKATPGYLVVQAHLGQLLLRKSVAETAVGLGDAAQRDLDEAAVIAETLRAKAPLVREHQVLFARVRFQQGRTSRSGPSPAACSMLQEAATVWSNLPGDGTLAPVESSERVAAVAAAEACSASSPPPGR